MHTQALDIDTLTAADIRAEYARCNNEGGGFDPSSEITGWALIRATTTTDDPTIYEDADGLYVLVGTDGMGTDESRWAVRPE